MVCVLHAYAAVHNCHMYVLTWTWYVYKPGVYSLLVSVGVGVLVAGVTVAEVEEDKQLP